MNVVDIVQGVGVQAVGQFAVDGVQAIVHGAVNLVPVVGPLLGRVIGLVL